MSDPTQGQEPVTPAGEPTPEPSTPKVEMVPKTEVDKLYARAKQAEEGEKRLKEELAAFKQAPAPTPAPQADDIEAVLRLRSEGYSDKEILEVRSKAKKYGVPIVNLLEDDLIKSGIEAGRAKAKVEQATPQPSTRSNPTVGGKEFNQMTPDERSKNFNFQSWKGRKGGQV